MYLHFFGDGVFLFKDTPFNSSTNRRRIVIKFSLGRIGGTRRSDIFCELAAKFKNLTFLFKTVTLLLHVRRFMARRLTAKQEGCRGLRFSATITAAWAGIVTNDSQIVDKIQQMIRIRFCKASEDKLF